MKGERLRQYGSFPDIRDFEQTDISTSSSTNVVNGQVLSTQSVTQTYLPTSQGTFRLAPFTISVNDQLVSSQGATITVGPPQQQSAHNADPFEDFFGRRKPQKFVEVEDSAFLALTLSKDEVYLGEGFTATLAFYMVESDLALLQFYDLSKQLTDILKKIKPSNAWEEDFNIESIKGVPVEIGGKNYIQQTIYQATFYPLNLESITFPSISLDMIKYRIAENPSFFGRRRQEGIKTFKTKPKTVQVKDLPFHPLKDAVAVGNYQLEESESQQEVSTGGSLNYRFKVVGEGNISAIEKPTMPSTNAFEVYPPTTEQHVNRRNGRVRGSKTFSYYLVANEPGTYPLDDLFHWIYFNPDTERYDTLFSDIQIAVTGKSRQNEIISTQDVGAFYDQIGRTDNTLTERNATDTERLVANVLILLMLVLTIVVVFRK